MIKEKDIYNNIANKSIGNKMTRKEKFELKMRMKSIMRKKKQNIGKTICLVSLITLLGATDVVIGCKIFTDLQRVPKTDRACLIVKEEASNVLVLNDLAYYDEEEGFVVKNNDVADYDALDFDNASLEELYAYFSIMSPNEFNKLVKSIKDENNKQMYENLSDFYIKNNFVDYSGNPDGKKFEYSSEAKLYDIIRKHKIHDVVTAYNGTQLDKGMGKNLILQ